MCFATIACPATASTVRAARERTWKLVLAGDPLLTRAAVTPDLEPSAALRDATLDSLEQRELTR